MGKKPIYIFGIRYAGPRGLRRSPGTNWLANCVRASLDGKKFGSRGAVKTAFTAAAKECAKTHGL